MFFKAYFFVKLFKHLPQRQSATVNILKLALIEAIKVTKIAKHPITAPTLSIVSLRYLSAKIPDGKDVVN